MSNAYRIFGNKSGLDVILKDTGCYEGLQAAG